MKRLVSILLLFVMVVSIGTTALGESYDLGGRTIRIQTQWADITPLGARGDFNWYHPDARLQAHIESVEKMFNCKIEFVYEGHRRDALAHLRQSILAGDQPFDFFQHSITPELIGDGLIQPLNDYVDDDFYAGYPTLFQRPDPGLGTSVGNTIYTFESSNSSPGNKYILWNKTLLEREGIESLYDIYERGEWTWEKFEEIAHALTKDTDGDGEIDQWGIRSVNLKEEIIVMLVSNSARVSKTTDDGKVVFDLLNPQVIETLDFMQKLYNDGVWAPRNTADLGQAAMTIQTGTEISGRGYQDHFTLIGEEWGIILPPQGPNGKNEYNMYAAPSGVIPIYVEDPGAVMEVVSALWQVKTPYIENMEEWEASFWANHTSGLFDIESYNFLTAPEVEPIFQPAPIEREILFPSTTPEVFTRIIMEGESTTSVLASEKPVFQALLDEILKQ